MKKSLARQRQTEKVSQIKSDRAKKSKKSEQINIRNMGCEMLPENVANMLNSIISLDVSHNRLGNSQIDYIFNHGKNIKYLQIQNNLSTLIPASIWKLTNLSHFRHDWVKVFGLQEESNIVVLQTVSRKPEKIVKMHSVCGINFTVYCQAVIRIPVSLKLRRNIERSDCSDFAKQQMLKLISNTTINKQVKIAEKQGNFFMANYPGCMMLLGIAQSQTKNKNSITLKQSSQDNESSSNRSNQGKISIKINQIKNISSSNGDITTSTGNISYFEPDLPLHNIFIRFDSMERPQKQVEDCLGSKENPNVLDSKGLSIYHLCVIYNQQNGLKYLLDLNRKHPGIVDMLTNDKKSCRNIAHYCTFLKNLDMLNLLTQQAYPLNYRDSSGSRAIHLIDQNLQFLMQYRKILKKNKQISKKSMPIHPQRLKRQSKIMIVEKRNDELLRQYEAVVGFPLTFQR